MAAKTFAIGAGVLLVAATGACNAHAEPPRFPDVGSYTPVDVGDYAVDASTPGVCCTIR